MKPDVEKINYNGQKIAKVTYYYDNGIKKSESFYVNDFLKSTILYDEKGSIIESTEKVKVIPTNDSLYKTLKFYLEKGSLEEKTNLLVSDKESIGIETVSRKTTGSNGWTVIDEKRKVEFFESKDGFFSKTIKAEVEAYESEYTDKIQEKITCTSENPTTKEKLQVIYTNNSEIKQQSILILKNGDMIKQIIKNNGKITICEKDKNLQIKYNYYDENGTPLENPFIYEVQEKIDPEIIDNLKDSLIYDYGKYDRIYNEIEPVNPHFKIDKVIDTSVFDNLFPDSNKEKKEEQQKVDSTNPIAQQKIDALEKAKQAIDKRLETLTEKEAELYRKINEIVRNPELSINEREYQKTELEIELLEIQNGISCCPRDKKTRDYAIEQINLLLQRNAGKIDETEYSYLDTMSKSNQHIYLNETDREFCFSEIEITKKKMYFESLKEKQGLITSADRILNQKNLEEKIKKNEEFLQQQEEQDTKEKEKQTRAEIYYKWRKGEISKEEVQAYENGINQKEDSAKHR